MKYNLDFNLETAQERSALVNEIDFSKLSSKDLELCANYILWGKDPEYGMTSATDRKEVFIKTRYNSYSRNEPVSLESLMESPTFDESQFLNGRYIYKKTKETIDREKHKSIPGMVQLWEEIDREKHRLKVAKGEEKPYDGEIVKPLSSKEIYHLNHHLIALYKEQYLLKETSTQDFRAQKNYGSFWRELWEDQLCYPVFPCGTMRSQFDKSFTSPFEEKTPFAAISIEDQIRELEEKGKPYFNFLDKNHIYYLCLAYQEIKSEIEFQPDSPLWNLLWTLDFYIEKANLNEQQKIILEGKKNRLMNREICKNLMDQLGIYHQENYISTIWNKICELIAAAADLSYDEKCCWNYQKAWKQCNTCKEWKLIDPRNFVRKAKSADGFTSRCKCCDKKKRKGEI